MATLKRAATTARQIILAEGSEMLLQHPNTPWESLDMACNCECHFGEPNCDVITCAQLRTAKVLREQGEAVPAALPILQDEDRKVPADATIAAIITSPSNHTGAPRKSSGKRAAAHLAPVAARTEVITTVIEPPTEGGHEQDEDVVFTFEEPTRKSVSKPKSKGKGKTRKTGETRWVMSIG